MDRKPVLIRADASAAIGTGHVMRDLVLARALARMDVPVVWLCRELPDALADLLTGEGFRVLGLEAQERDAEAGAIVRAAEDIDARAVVIDHYGIAATVEEHIRRAGFPVMVVDDMYEHHQCDLILNQNLYASKAGYRGHIPEECRILGGWRYALLRDEFVEAPRRPRNRPGSDGVRVLVSLGGADTPNVTQRVLDALERVDGFSLHVEVIVGASNVHRPALLDAVAASPLDIEILTDVRDMARRMDRADLAVTAGGTTHLELVASTLPALMITIADNQELVTAHMGSEGLALALGWHEDVGEDAIAAAITELLAHPTRYDEMHRRLAAHGPPGGADRVARALLDLAHRDFVLEPIGPEDLMDVFRLSSDSEVRRNAFNTAPIPLEEHRSWFARRLAGTDGIFHAVRDRDGAFIGQLRLDGTDPGVRRWTLTFSLVPAARGRGLGRLILLRTLRGLRGTGPFHIDAWVKTDNSPSLGSFLDAGFEDRGEETVHGARAHKLTFQGE
ncbi:MAG: UDP-2,4-diacetamido-2,4,6-trideoxy-beta-L-altropyranose hydrolase [Pseudomonadota bacterium]